MSATVQNYLTNYGTTGYNPTLNTSGVPENWALQGHGVKKRYAQQTIAPLSTTDSSASNYLLFKNVPADAIINRLDLEIDAGCDAIYAQIGVFDSILGTATAGTGSGQGGYCMYGAVTTGTDFTSATTPSLGSMLDGLGNLLHEARLVPLWSLAGDTLLTKKGNYDIVLTAVSGIGSSGKITAHAEFLDNG